MTKMGYEPGKGLGKDGEGRVQPVPIQLLPQGQYVIFVVRDNSEARNTHKIRFF